MSENDDLDISYESYMADLQKHFRPTSLKYSQLTDIQKKFISENIDTYGGTAVSKVLMLKTGRSFNYKTMSDWAKRIKNEKR
jgi:hypothetical protein